MPRECSTDELIRLFEEAYLRVAKDYGIPAITSPKVWGMANKGVYEAMNEVLIENGCRPLAWAEFREFLKVFDSPRWYGIVHVDYGIAKTNEVEPIVVTVYRPLLSKSWW